MDTNPDNFTPLSDAGERRRAAILLDAQRVAKETATHRRRLRQARRVVAVAVLLGAGVFLTQRWMPERDSRSEPSSIVIGPKTTNDPSAHASVPKSLPTSMAVTPPDAPAVEPYTTFRFARIKSDPAILAAHTMSTRDVTPLKINDDELLGTLQAAGIDAGLAHVGNATELILNQMPSMPSPLRRDASQQ